MFFTSYQLNHPYNGKNSELFYPIILFATAFISFFILKAYIDIKNQTDAMMNKLYQEIILKAQISSLVGLVEGMSHEINNPLTVISLKNQKTIDLLKNKSNLSSEDITTAINNLEKVNESTKRITKVISSLFKFSQQIEMEEITSVNLMEIINNAKDVVNFRTEARKIKIAINCPNEIVIKTKKAQLSQAMVNLINNAIDSFEDTSAGNSLIDISLIGKNENYITLAFTDNGKGISPENHDKIFLPFFTTKDVGKGIGMGLSLSLGIIQSIGGDLWLDKKHANTRFVIKLPINL
jgi:C4-dicarboxylate-specific signal transduction histidine kinase